MDEEMLSWLYKEYDINVKPNEKDEEDYIGDRIIEQEAEEIPLG